MSGPRFVDSNSFLSSTDQLIEALGTGEDRAKSIEKKLLVVLPPDKSFHVVIVGGGESGVHSALAFAKIKGPQGRPLYQVTLIEKNHELMMGNSSITPGRAGQGYHYAHAKTSLKWCQTLTQDFKKHYPNCFVQSESKGEHTHEETLDPLRRGRYVVMKESDPAPLVTWQGYKNSAKAYRESVARDKNNEVWGSPDNFLKLLYVAEDQPTALIWDASAPSYAANLAAVKELEKKINLKDVAFVVETAEELIDMKAYRQQTLAELFQYVKKHEQDKYANVTILTDTEVLAMRSEGTQQFSIRIRNKTTQNGSDLFCDYPVICAAERSDYLISQSFTIASPTVEETTNRLKSIITVDLTDSEELLNTNSYFFCHGPYMMFSNMGDGIGKITYAPVTNMGKSDASGPLTSKMEYYLSGQVDPVDNKRIAEKILAGAIEFMPSLKGVKILNINYGVVKVRGNIADIDINHPQGKIGERDYGWVKKHDLHEDRGFIIENCTTKIPFALKNARDSLALVNEGLYLRCLAKPSFPKYLFTNRPYNNIILNLQNHLPSQEASLRQELAGFSEKTKLSPVFRPSNGSMALRPPSTLFPPDRTMSPYDFHNSDPSPLALEKPVQHSQPTNNNYGSLLNQQYSIHITLPQLVPLFPSLTRSPQRVKASRKKPDEPLTPQTTHSISPNIDQKEEQGSQSSLFMPPSPSYSDDSKSTHSSPGSSSKRLKYSNNSNELHTPPSSPDSDALSTISLDSAGSMTSMGSSDRSEVSLFTSLQSGRGSSSNFFKRSQPLARRLFPNSSNNSNDSNRGVAKVLNIDNLPTSYSNPLQSRR